MSDQHSTVGDRPTVDDQQTGGSANGDDGSSQRVPFPLTDRGLDRRQFLKLSARTVAALTILPQLDLVGSSDAVARALGRALQPARTLHTSGRQEGGRGRIRLPTPRMHHWSREGSARA